MSSEPLKSFWAIKLKQGQLQRFCRFVFLRNPVFLAKSEEAKPVNFVGVGASLRVLILKLT